jgi:hypothetical protein
LQNQCQIIKLLHAFERNYVLDLSADPGTSLIMHLGGNFIWPICFRSGN